MTNKFSRRKLFSMTGLGAAASLVLTGCGPDSRYVTRQPYNNMPEYNQTGISTYYATTCRECPASCGLIVRTMEGRALKIEGNPSHPVNKGKICARGLTSVQGLYNPDRLQGPRKLIKRGAPERNKVEWSAALKIVQDALSSTPASGIAFLTGETPDHLFDFLRELTAAIGAPPPVRYGAQGELDGRSTLAQAAGLTYGKAVIPFFDLTHADVVFSFGANFLETWLSPVMYSQAYGQMRHGNLGKRGYLVSFEARQSLTSANADEWIPVEPGSEIILAAALGKRIAELSSVAVPSAYQAGDIKLAAQFANVSEEKLQSIAQRFAAAEHPLAFPGSGVLTGKDGVVAAQAVLGLNILVGNSGKAGGVYLSSGIEQGSNFGQVKYLTQRMQKGEVKVLFIHGVNPVFELPGGLGFKEALAKVPLVISFSNFFDDTSLFSDYLLPDHFPLEAFGYQRMLPGVDRPIYSASQPVVVPVFDTRATIDVLLAATAGGAVTSLKYSDEVDFIQQKTLPLINAGGAFTAPEILSFWSQFLQYGGWWHAAPALEIPGDQGTLNISSGAATPPRLPNENFYHLVIYPTHLGDGHGANYPWLQETPNPMTTVMWNSWVEIHPDTAAKLGIKDDDVVQIHTAAGTIEASAYLYPAIRPDTIAIPFGQGHEELGQYAKNRGCNPARLLTDQANLAGGVVLTDTLVSISLTGRKKALSRYENREGVYGAGRKE